MLISVTGILTDCNSLTPCSSVLWELPKRPVMLRDHRGFTLLEVLIVLVIIGIMIGMVGLRIDTAPEPGREAERFALLADQLREESVLTGREQGVLFWSQGYCFVTLAESGWQLFAGDDLFRTRSLQQSSLRLLVADEKVSLGEEPQVCLAMKDGDQPVLLFLSSDEITSFELQFLGGDNQPVAWVTGDSFQGITVRTNPSDLEGR